MKGFAIASLSALLFSHCSPASDEADAEDRYYMPEEYAPHEAVWLGWQEYPPYHEPFMAIARALLPHVPVKIIANDSSQLRTLQQGLAENGIDPRRIAFRVFKDNRLWMRDHGATYVVNEIGQKKVVDFGWTLYGSRDYLKTYYDGNRDSVAYHYQKNLGTTGLIDSLMGAIDGFSSVKTDVNMEGGSIEVNGRGTLILCEAVTMQRNPDLTKAYLESEFKRTLGVTNILWMKKGLVEDPYWFDHIFDDYYGWGTYGHTDEFVRFANDSTVLLAWVDEAEKNRNAFNRINYDRMSENLAILEQSTDQDGRPLTIIKVPLPDPVFLQTTVTRKAVDWNDRATWKVPLQWFPEQGVMQEGDSIKLVAAASYLNYLVTNGVVLLPTYVEMGSSPEKEQRVKELFSSVFPDRRLELLDVVNLNFHGGGIHCVTQQEPATTPPTGYSQ